MLKVRTWFMKLLLLATRAPSTILLTHGITRCCPSAAEKPSWPHRAPYACAIHWPQGRYGSPGVQPRQSAKNMNRKGWMERWGRGVVEEKTCIKNVASLTATYLALGFTFIFCPSPNPKEPRSLPDLWARPRPLFPPGGDDQGCNKILNTPRR